MTADKFILKWLKRLPKGYWNEFSKDVGIIEQPKELPMTREQAKEFALDVWIPYNVQRESYLLGFLECYDLLNKNKEK